MANRRWSHISNNRGVLMTKRTRTPTILALLIAAVLAGGYLIVTQNNSAMNAGLSCGRCAASLRLTGCAGHRRFAPDASNPAVPIGTASRKARRFSFYLALDNTPREE